MSLFPHYVLPLEATNAYEILDRKFAGVQGDIGVERLAGGCRWAEGPTYVPAGRYLLWSDIPNDRMMRWDEATGAVAVFRHPAGHANGSALDAQGRLVLCEQGRRRITRTEHDGSITVLVERWNGMRLNSPNDLAIARDGAIWFTDAAYGIDSDYEGRRGESEIGACHVYRLDPSGSCEVIVDDFSRPTGIAFSPDEQVLYVADSRANHLRRFAVDGAHASGGEVIATNDIGSFDSMAVDEEGRVWLAAGDGIHCLLPDGTLIGKIRVPEMASHVDFGGPDRNRLFMTASTSVYSITLTVRGAPPPYSGSADRRAAA